MPQDDYGNKIKVGDKISLSVGIPSIEVIVDVKRKRGRLVAENADGSMAVSSVLKYFPTEVVKS
jgi:hypothetical protein